jgi:chitosanase
MQDKHSFSEADKLKALSIINIFETSRPMGDHSAVAVLDDGAGISYGMAQFTHRSGSLAAVVDAYLETNCPVSRDVFLEMRPLLEQRSEIAISRLASRSRFKNALREAAKTEEMKAAQRETAFRLYLGPAIDICEKRGFTLPLSLAVVYDGVVHGSFDLIARKVPRNEHVRTEKDWISSYVRRRHLWLTNIARLKKTSYRTRFFLEQIFAGNWELRLPLNVNGYRLTFVGPQAASLPMTGQGDLARDTAHVTDSPLPVDALQEEPTQAGSLRSDVFEQFDRIDNAVSGVIRRTDRAKSLWTTVGGTLWQAAWAVFGFLAGIPREIWIVVAVIAAVLTILYLYRQIILGKIREAFVPEGDT